jgi:RNA polymerase sigma-70 factor (ECF subfamily)
LDKPGAAGQGASDFDARLAQHVRVAYRLARAILLDDAEAEDAVQDACLAAWRRRSSLRDDALFTTWFDRILINGCRDRLRSRQRRQVRAISLQGTWHESSDVPPSDGSLLLDAALDRLDLDHRLVILLRYWQDLPLEAIAERLGIPTGTVKSRLHYALAALRTGMEADDGRG